MPKLDDIPSPAISIKTAITWHSASNARELVAYAERKASRGEMGITNIAASEVSSII